MWYTFCRQLDELRGDLDGITQRILNSVNITEQQEAPAVSTGQPIADYTLL